MERIIIFGTGLMGEKVYKEVKESCEVTGFLDNNRSKWGEEFYGHPILGNAESLSGTVYDRIIVASVTGMYAVRDNLLAEKIPEEKIDMSFVEKPAQRRIRKLLGKTVLFKPVMNLYNVSCQYFVPWFMRIFGPVGYFRNYIIFPVSAFFRKHRIKPFYNKNLQHIDSFRNRYRDSGRRCFIVATGPSLTLADINELHENGEYTIGMNGIYKIFDKTVWRPDVYVSLDPYVEKKVRDDKDFKPGEFSKDISLLNALFIKPGMYEDVYLLHTCPKNNWFKVSDMEYDHAKNAKYNPDIVSGVFGKYVITNTAIEIAVFLGFKEIYLIGVDNNYSGKSSHFYEKNQKNEEEDMAARALIHAATECYEFMERETKKHGIHVYNATRGGSLEAFDRVDFDSLFDA